MDLKKFIIAGVVNMALAFVILKLWDINVFIPMVLATIIISLIKNKKNHKEL